MLTSIVAILFLVVALPMIATRRAKISEVVLAGGLLLCLMASP